MNEQFVLITGSPMTGFVMTGPFPTRDEACKYASVSVVYPYWIAPLFPPKEKQP